MISLGLIAGYLTLDRPQVVLGRCLGRRQLVVARAPNGAWMDHTAIVFEPSSLTEEQFARWRQESGFAELRQILYWLWDPLDVNNAFPHTHDEYDRYAQVVLSMLGKGASTPVVVEYLVSVEKGPMGMGRAVDLTPLGERIMEWYGESIPYWLDRQTSS